jgi:hypothetical protein
VWFHRAIVESSNFDVCAIDGDSNPHDFVGKRRRHYYLEQGDEYYRNQPFHELSNCVRQLGGRVLEKYGQLATLQDPTSPVAMHSSCLARHFGCRRAADGDQRQFLAHPPTPARVLRHVSQ